jgi:ubiquitin C-terminal hydrolase
VKEHRNERGVLLSSVKKHVANINPEFAGYAQNDGHEFLRALMLGLHNELNSVKGKYKEMKDIEGEPDWDAATRWFRYHQEHDDSVVYDTFGGLLKMVTTCHKCCYRSVSFDPFLDLSVPVPKESESLERLLEIFTSDEHLKGTDRFVCPRCKKAREANRRLTIQRWPALLVVHLKRFNHRGVKNSVSVSFSDNLTAQPSCSALDNNYNGGRGFVEFSQNDVDDLPRYKLTGVVCHSGSSSFGHYYSYVCTASDQWFLCDDQTVRESSPREAIREAVNAYILFYAKVEL